ncbi:Leu/Ile/Val/Thr-binding protein [Burkholderiales bacterium]|nr:MAG: ABC transporter substrate-binding protein [Burkholderiales bacterium]CAG0988612.1 Leu/Ile/Val/Thr-binding protein [Burkholderiales bacterium]
MRMRSVFLLGGLLAASPLLAEPGVNAGNIVIGQSASLSGPTAPRGKEIIGGIQAYFNQVNAKGGVFGRKLVLEVLDDGYEADKTLANTKRFIAEGKVFALIGYRGTSHVAGAVPLLNQAKLPLIAPVTGADSLRNPANRFLFHVKASYGDETEAIVNQFNSFGLKRIAVFYQNDGFGKEGLAGVEAAMKARNLTLVAKGAVERNSNDVSNAVKSIAGANPEAVVVIAQFNAASVFVKAMRAAGSNPLFMAVSPVEIEQIAKNLGEMARGFAVAQVVPFPWNQGSPLVREYTKAVTGREDVRAGFASLEGFIAAKVLVEGLRRAGPQPTRDKLVAALETLRDFDLGGYTISYTPESHRGSRYVDLIVIGKDGRFMR